MRPRVRGAGRDVRTANAPAPRCYAQAWLAPIGGGGFFGCLGFFCSRFCLSRLPIASLLFGVNEKILGYFRRDAFEPSQSGG